MPVRDRVNPFFHPSTLPFQAPPFDRIGDEDYPIALEEGMAREIEEVRAIATNPDAPTFENTIEALERAGSVLRRVSGVFQEIANSNSNPILRRIYAEMAPRLAAHRDAIHLDPQLFERVKIVYDAPGMLGLNPESHRLVRRRYRDFIRAGAGLDTTDQQALRALNEEEALLTAEFHDRLLAATNAAAVVVEDRAALRGLSSEEVAAAAQCAADRGLPGRYVLTLENTTQQPVLATLEDRELRRRVLEASMHRGRGGPHDLTAIAARLAQIRVHRAKILGFPTFAAFELDDQMARTPERALQLLTGLVPAATAKAREEARRMETIVATSGAAFDLGAHDWPYLAEQVRRAEFAVDSNELRPYFELDRVLHDGVFFSARQLYGITLRARHDIPVYHPEVCVWEVFDHDGSPLALFYLDVFARPGKTGGAWSSSFISQSRLLGTAPVVVNVLNVTKPAAGDPVLLTFDQVVTLFHEFGHALHAMLSNTRYVTLGDTNVARDWVEFPSQINEHWALDPTIFGRYARHHRTGAPMPQALFERLERLRTFNQGYRTTEYLAAALLDHAWHTLPPDTPLQDVDAFEAAALDRFGVSIPAVPPRYSSAYFHHIWGRGYASTYYAYMWAEVMEEDAYRWIAEHGGLTRANGQRLREIVLSRGDTEDGDVMFRRLCGRDPDPEAMLVARGLASARSSNAGQHTKGRPDGRPS